MTTESSVAADAEKEKDPTLDSKEIPNSSDVKKESISDDPWDLVDEDDDIDRWEGAFLRYGIFNKRYLSINTG